MVHIFHDSFPAGVFCHNQPFLKKIKYYYENFKNPGFNLLVTNTTKNIANSEVNLCFKIKKAMHKMCECIIFDNYLLIDFVVPWS